MCGRYLIATEQEIIEIREIIDEINKRYGSGSAVKTGEIFPKDKVPVLSYSHNNILAQPMVWGFPGFNGTGVIINAKSETAFQKSMFKSSLLFRRCAVPCTGFFEWGVLEGGKNKEKYLFRLKNSPVLYMAGLYSLFKSREGSNFHGFVILTTAANNSVKPVHTRMPVILTQPEKDRWLKNPDLTSYILARPGPELIREKVG